MFCGTWSRECVAGPVGIFEQRGFGSNRLGTRPYAVLAGIRHREDKGVIADRDVGEGIARSKEQFPEAVHVLAALDTVLDARA